MNYQEYYRKIRDRVLPYSDVVYFEPMQETEIAELEEKIGKPIKPLYRDFLSTFGMIQDVFETLEIDHETFQELFFYIQDIMDGYIPVYADIDEEEVIYLIHNADPDDEWVYSLMVDEDDQPGDLQPYKPFGEILEASLYSLKKNHPTRCPNTKKIHHTEFIVQSEDFPAFEEAFREVGLKQKTEWQPKYYPQNLFGDEVARFDLFEQEIFIERDGDYSAYRFELEEPLLNPREQSIIHRCHQLFLVKQIEYTSIASRPVETE